MAASDLLGAFKSRHGIDDSADDAAINEILAASLALAESYTGRDYAATTATRYFTATSGLECEIDDLITLTTLKTDGQGDLTFDDTWTSADYVLMPRNTTPKRWITVHPTGNEAFPTHSSGVEVVGSFGYSATIPAEVREWVLEDAAAIFLGPSSSTTTGGDSGEGGATKRPPMSRLDGFRRMDLRT